MKKKLTVGSLTVAMTVLCVSAYANEPLSNFAQANAAYRDGHYEEAISGYETVLKSGFESGPLYYNLGNSYFKKQDLGKAVLNYERAKRLMPRDLDLNANMQFAMSEIKNNVQKPLGFWGKLWEGHIRFYSLTEMLMILAGLLVFLGAAHLVTLYYSWKAGRMVMCAAAVLLLIFAYGLKLKIGDEEGAQIVVAPTAARFEPNEKATTYFELNAGQRVYLHEREGPWAKIDRPDGKSGWVNGDALEGI